METIKKYSNRKLYSTSISKYVTLDYILDLIKTNQKFQVLEDVTKKNITKATMMRTLGLVNLSETSIASIIRGV